MTRLAGIDVSHNNGTINWAKVAKSDVAFAYAKATEGTTFVDPEFGHNRDGATKHGITFGAYHFGNPANEAVKEAAHFAATIGRRTGELPPCLDIEQTGGRSWDLVRKWCATFSDEVHKRTGVRPIVYCNSSYSESLTNLHDHHLWIASLRDTPEFSGWQDWTFWQHSWTGSVPGIGGDVDLDYFNGSRADLLALAGTAKPKPAPKPAPKPKTPKPVPLWLPLWFRRWLRRWRAGK